TWSRSQRNPVRRGLVKAAARVSRLVMWSRGDFLAGDRHRWRRLCFQLLSKQYIIVSSVRREFHQVLGMGEKEDLGVFGELSQSFESSCGAVVIEVDQEVVDDERDRLMLVEVGLQACETKC